MHTYFSFFLILAKRGRVVGGTDEYLLERTERRKKGLRGVNKDGGEYLAGPGAGVYVLYLLCISGISYP